MVERPLNEKILASCNYVERSSKMKYVSLSFDDGRSDTYEVAFPILKRHGFRATVNVISEYIVNPSKYHFGSAPKAMNKEQILEWQKEGFEVAAHGKTHSNTKEDILDNINDLKSFGINVKKIGFASPNSELTLNNIQSTGINELKKEKTLSYVRSGIQVKREGLFYVAGAVAEKITHGATVFYKLNKRNTISLCSPLPIILPSIAVKSYTTLKQLKYFLEKIDDNTATIFMIHSILNKSNEAYGTDDWYWDEGLFGEFLDFLTMNKNISVVTTQELVERWQE